MFGEVVRRPPGREEVLVEAEHPGDLAGPRPVPMAEHDVGGACRSCLPCCVLSLPLCLRVCVCVRADAEPTFVHQLPVDRVDVPERHWFGPPLHGLSIKVCSSLLCYLVFYLYML